MVERARLAHLFVGSANATDAGFGGGNIEFLCELVGPVARYGVDALVGNDTEFRTMLAPYVATESPDTDEAETAARDLGDLLFRIAGEVGFRTTVSRRSDGWAAYVESETGPTAVSGGDERYARGSQPAD